MALLILCVVVWEISFAIGFLHHGFYTVAQYSYTNDIMNHKQWVANTEYNATTFLIGVGCIKCGSSSVHNFLYKYTAALDTSSHHWYMVAHETHYFEQCSTRYPNPFTWSNHDCSFENYIKSARIRFKMSAVNASRVIVCEKTPTYHYDDGSVYYLTMYAHVYNVKFYLLLRDPIQRLWSNLWMEAKGLCSARNQPFSKCIFWRETFRLNSSDISDAYVMNDRLGLLMKFYDKKYRASYQLLKALEIRDNENSNDQLNEDRIVHLYIKARYEHSIFYRSIYQNPILSCYYPILLMWKKYWKEWDQSAIFIQQPHLALHQRLKIIQTESVLDKGMGIEILQQLVCWILGGTEYEMDLNKCKAENPNMVNFNPKMKRIKQNAPDTVDVMDLSIANTLKRFYADCNQRLYMFLMQNPEFMLGQRPFTPWQDY
eukprot:374911_1